MGRLLAALVLAVFLLRAAPAATHAMPNSTVNLDVSDEGVAAHLVIPLEELAPAFGRKVTLNTVEADRADLDAYLRRHVALKTPDGRLWDLRSVALAGAMDGDHSVLKADLAFAPPAGAPPRNFYLAYDAVTHEVMSHYALVYVRNLYTTAPPGTASPAGRLQMPVKDLAVMGGPFEAPPASVEAGAVSPWTVALPIGVGLLALAGLGLLVVLIFRIVSRRR